MRSALLSCPYTGRMQNFRFIAIILTISCLIGCKSYSHYPIDTKPMVVIDTNFLGMWRCVEDTDKANFVEVQTVQDLYHMEETKYGNIDNYLVKTIDTIRKEKGPKWNPATDPYITSIRNDIDNQRYLYYFTYFDAHGINPHYQQWNAHPSTVNKTRFLSFNYHNPYSNNKDDKGWLLVRIIKAAHDTIITAIVADKTLKNLKSSNEVRSRLAQRLNDKHFYSDTMHFYKINGYHLTLNKAIKLANKQSK